MFLVQIYIGDNCIVPVGTTIVKICEDSSMTALDCNGRTDVMNVPPVHEDYLIHKYYKNDIVSEITDSNEEIYKIIAYRFLEKWFTSGIARVWFPTKALKNQFTGFWNIHSMTILSILKDCEYYISCEGDKVTKSGIRNFISDLSIKKAMINFEFPLDIGDVMTTPRKQIMGKTSAPPKIIRSTSSRKVYNPEFPCKRNLGMEVDVGYEAETPVSNMPAIPEHIKDNLPLPEVLGIYARLGPSKYEERISNRDLCDIIDKLNVETDI